MLGRPGSTHLALARGLSQLLLSPKNLELELEVPTLCSNLDRGEANREAGTDVRQVGGLPELFQRQGEPGYTERKMKRTEETFEKLSSDCLDSEGLSLSALGPP